MAHPEELDMTPMMNILIILISFLVTMVVFTHLAILKFDLPESVANEDQESAQDSNNGVTSPEEDLTVVISNSGFRFVTGTFEIPPIPKSQGVYDLVGLDKSLRTLKGHYPTSASLVLLVDAEVEYQDLINVMDHCRENRFSDLMLSGGFEG